MAQIQEGAKPKSYIMDDEVDKILDKREQDERLKQMLPKDSPHRPVDIPAHGPGENYRAQNSREQFDWFGSKSAGLAGEADSQRTAPSGNGHFDWFAPSAPVQEARVSDEGRLGRSSGSS